MLASDAEAGWRGLRCLEQRTPRSRLGVGGLLCGYRLGRYTDSRLTDWRDMKEMEVDTASSIVDRW